MLRGLRAAAGVLLLGVLAAACGPDDSPAGEAGTTEKPVPTLSPIKPPPEGPPTGKLYADLRQSSRDAALGRMEVWIGNDTRHDVTPTRISYIDPRFRGPVPGERLRLNPSRSERGYPLALPASPECGQQHGRGRLTVTYGGRTVTLPVTDDNDIVQRYVDSRCLALAVGRVAELAFADEVRVDHEGEGSTGTLTLVVRPTGVAGHVLRIDDVGGTPLLGAAGGEAWRPHVRVRGDDPVQRIELPVRPARCDDHVFMESAGATAFLVSLHLDGRPGSLVVRMSPAGASAAISFARDSCGL
ncbi:hypothetical protein ACT8ZV_07485 [Nocardioides sp. MAHUQ-72]|uniref:hypothetical protein n=1 Tax=unclassified Nocardioides TaxID=2615069 RepID=UPI0036090548